nr:lantibiotic dehydratase [Micromonospora tarensis]
MAGDLRGVPGGGGRRPDALRRRAGGRRAVLRALADDPDLRGGILLASPSLDSYLAGYVTGSGPLGKRARRIERSLLEYAYRTAAKTSPFSRLTTVNVGTFEAGSGELLRVVPGTDQTAAATRGSARLNLAALGRLSAIVLADQTLRADLPVTLTTGWRIAHGRLRYLRRRRTSSEDGEAAITLESIHESLFVLPTGRVLHDILAALDGGRVRRMADLVTELSTDERPADEIAQYLHHLLRVGLLVVPNLQLDIHADDPVEGYRAALRQIGRDWSDRLAGRVARANQLATGYPTRDVPGRRRALNGIRDELVAAHADLGRPDIPAPRTLLYEDATRHTDTPVTADRIRWQREILPGLRALAQIMPVFDINLPRRLATKGFFRARYGDGGRCDDLLTFAHEFHQDFFEHYSGRMMRRRPFDEDNRYVRQENWFRQDEITALDDARLEVARRMNEAYDRLPADAEELVLDDSFMADVAALVPQTLGTLDPRSFFLQLADQGDRHRVVVNRVYSGMTLLFSRFAHLFAEQDLAGALRAELLRLQPPGAVLADSRAGTTPPTSTCIPPSPPTNWSARGRSATGRRPSRSAWTTSASNTIRSVTGCCCARGVSTPRSSRSTSGSCCRWRCRRCSRCCSPSPTSAWPSPTCGPARQCRCPVGASPAIRASCTATWCCNGGCGSCTRTTCRPVRRSRATPGGSCPGSGGGATTGCRGGSSPPRRQPARPGGRGRRRPAREPPGPQAALRGLRQPLLAATARRDGAWRRQSTRAHRDAAGPGRAAGARRRRHVRHRADCRTQRGPRRSER